MHNLMTECRICGKRDCDDDCEELRVIYREHQREKLRDIDIDEITCDVCGLTYGQESHDLCRELACNEDGGCYDAQFSC